MNINFSDLKTKIDDSIKTIFFNEQNIEVKQYLPIEEKNTLVSRVINFSSDDGGYFNPMRVQMYGTLEIIYAYTNISFTEEEKEDETKLYDAIVSSGLYEAIVQEGMSAREFEDIWSSIWDVIRNIYKFNNSFAGALNAMSQDYDNLNVDINHLQEEMRDPNNLELLKQVLTKLG